MANLKTRRRFLKSIEDTVAFLWGELLPSTSRTFAFTLKKLPKRIGLELAVAYEVVRILDTVEDSDLKGEYKEFYMQQFLNVLTVPTGNSYRKLASVLKNVPTGHRGYRLLLKHAPRIVQLYRFLDREVQKIILSTSREMADGFLDKKIQTITTLEDQNRYCHYAAGLVGDLITRLFVHHGYVGKDLERSLMEKGHDFGVALQKVNIMKDVKKDVQERRYYWPRKWVEGEGLTYGTLIDERHEEQAYRVLGRLLEDVRPYLARALEYTDTLPSSPIGLRVFCGDSALMALATARELKIPERFFSSDDVKISREEVRAIDAAVVEKVRLGESLKDLAEFVGKKPAMEWKG